MNLYLSYGYASTTICRLLSLCLSLTPYYATNCCLFDHDPKWSEADLSVLNPVFVGYNTLLHSELKTHLFLVLLNYWVAT